MKSIAGYDVIKLLAKGGMAAIYLAEQTSLKRQVVLKFLNPKLDEKIRKRFIDEGRIIASLKHPNIITVFDVVSSGKYDFLSMEYLPDGDLESRLISKPDVYFSLNIIKKISDAVHLIHKQGIIHGDIKPANILFRGKDCPLLTDFGISHRIEPKKEVDLSPDDL
ncbi:MAG: serine/threonine protein kinase [gamma proteobacterium symbiont of Bathyaustriella thionipta]|nr:serine/threonine protein kinase [gamma proteobacterium symbiont of Bathyaustriella thionipta]MCU7949929.1 serine/threonine protein kinase [gamma proteobacterium symbiont of Bathyaustriella thionipta]MCU7954703.1 serine/threonine protein kinase [gamma proteobacterium symbiont of Bathyaustriella thionipta]MCU7956512.1 serine/threonine protein kinase [gamma proteobacterium symbiont of Bathyaustriella thionipta]MCU7966593.1 serine/threonine protein kinase [gamma proteobacterium symbiont of Bathy